MLNTFQIRMRINNENVRIAQNIPASDEANGGGDDDAVDHEQQENGAFAYKINKWTFSNY